MTIGPTAIRLGVPINTRRPLLDAVSHRGDSDAKRYYFENVLDPSVFYVDLSKVDMNEGAKAMKLAVMGPVNLAGDVCTEFTPAAPFKFLAP